MQEINNTMQTDSHTPADFRRAYQYLEHVERNGQEVDWEVLKQDPETMTDVLLLGIMYRAKHGQ